ncbi:DUF1801 domain-containing protein [Dyella sp. C9]|uniref:DUF1801 domain-containing protein n=1 Tax=Dyella sp. C9 TaxID=2202154 RepID=UPI000DEEAE68|nr:DUF1801 domain-containing protein [Dyella sp. C9]
MSIGDHPSEHIDQLIAGIDDWRGEMLAALRKTILETDPAIVEEWKWKGSPVWSCDGMLAVGNAHKAKVKLTFAHGAKLVDPQRLFNAGLGGSAWRAIDFLEGDTIDQRALKELIRAAIAYNHSRGQSSAAKKSASGRAPAKRTPGKRRET